MAAGYLYYLTVDGDSVNFQRLSVRSTAPPIEASSRLKRDGTPNQGFSAKAEDLSTLRFELTQLEEDSDPTSVPLALPVGVNDVSWELGYNGIKLYSGSSIYIEEYQNDGSVPGAGTTGVTFYNNEDYTTA